MIAREVGFGKNPHAAGLRTSRSHLIGVLVPHLTDIVLSTIYDGIGAQARTLGYQTFVTNTHDEVDLRAEAAEMLLARRVDGLILGDAAVTGDELAADLTRRDVPFVLASRRSDDFPSVTCDDVLGGRMAAEHLLERGHRRVGVLAGTLRASTGLDRTRGFVEAYANAGYEIADEAIIHSPFDVSSGREAADELLRSRPRITAIFAVNDFTAIGAFGAVRAHGLEAGTDVAVVGYNDTPVAAQLPIPMTSVRSPMHDIGIRQWTCSCNASMAARRHREGSRQRCKFVKARQPQRNLAAESTKSAWGTRVPVCREDGFGPYGCPPTQERTRTVRMFGWRSPRAQPAAT